MANLPEGFVYLDQVDSSILQNMAYATVNNFIGQKIDGYLSNRAIITASAAQALSLVQQDLLKDGFCIVVYDAYRPQKAVNHFISWSKDEADLAMKAHYYPHIDKKDLFDLGYIAKKSSHSRGSAVDISLIRAGEDLVIQPEERKFLDGRSFTYIGDGTLDMQSHFDLFDEGSWHDSPLVGQEASKNRNYLREKMQMRGFKPYDKEWWHYELSNEPFPDTYFDFDYC
jgi:D-alanyl-D-alanine dipeptidase